MVNFNIRLRVMDFHHGNQAQHFVCGNVVLQAHVENFVQRPGYQRVHHKRQLLLIIEKRQTSFIGHIIRKGELENLALSGKIEGKKARGGQRKRLLDNFPKTSIREIWDKAQNREKLGNWQFGSSGPFGA